MCIFSPFYCILSLTFGLYFTIAGSISSYEFTMCHTENGGKLFLGPGAYPDDMMIFPTLPFDATFSVNDTNAEDGTTWYTLKGPDNGDNVELIVDNNGNETVISSTDINDYRKNWPSMLDSGKHLYFSNDYLPFLLLMSHLFIFFSLELEYLKRIYG